MADFPVAASKLRDHHRALVPPIWNSCYTRSRLRASRRAMPQAHWRTSDRKSAL